MVDEVMTLILSDRLALLLLTVILAIGLLSKFETLLAPWIDFDRQETISPLNSEMDELMFRDILHRVRILETRLDTVWDTLHNRIEEKGDTHEH